MMQSVVASALGLPPVQQACAWGDSCLVLCHSHGFVSVIDQGEVLVTIQVPGQTIVYSRAVQDTLYLSFESGLFSSYSLPLGIRQQSVHLRGAVAGIFVQESSVVAWGYDTQVTFLNRFTLDIEKTLVFDSLPVRVCRDKQLAIVLQSGTVHWLDKDRQIIRETRLPLDMETAKLIDAACIDSGMWVCVQRDKWSVVQQVEGEMILEFTASAPDMLQSLLISPRMSTFAITCDNGQLLLVENNNIQVLEPLWPPHALKGLIWGNEPTAILSDKAYSSFLEDKIWAWKPLKIPPANASMLWQLSGRHAARGRQFGNLDVVTAEFDPLYTAEAPISAILVQDASAVLGLENGTVVVLDLGGAIQNPQAHRLLTSPINFIVMFPELVVAASEHSVAIHRHDQLPVIVAVDECITNVGIGEPGILYIETTRKKLAYCLETFKPLNITVSPLEPPVAQLHQPFIIGNHSDQAELIGIQSENSTCFFPSKPDSRTAAAIYSIRCSQGMPTDEAEDDLRKLGVTAEQFENLLILLNHENPKMCSAAADLLQSLTDNKRIEALMQQGGIRPSLIFSALYPKIPVKEWLIKSVDELFAGDTTDQLVALQIVAHHSQFLAFPFKQLNSLHIQSAIDRFIKTAGANNKEGITKTLSSALDTKGFRYFTLCVECILSMVQESQVTINSSDFITLIGAVCHAVHRTPTGMGAVRKLFACILKKYPKQILFHKERQLLFVHSSAGPPETEGLLWELQNGRQLTLASDETPASEFTFSSDGKRIEAGTSAWRLPGGIISLFDSSTVIRPIAA